ncbi:MAG: hypothetical protein ACK4SS_00410, partial [Cypionkella sp.]
MLSAFVSFSQARLAQASFPVPSTTQVGVGEASPSRARPLSVASAPVRVKREAGDSRSQAEPPATRPS